MFRFLPPLVAILISTAPSIAQIPLDDSTAHHLLILEQRDGQPRGPLDQMFRADRRLDVLRSRVHYTVLDPSQTEAGQLYASRYETAIPRDTLPALVLMRSDGGVIFKASRDTMPRDANQMHDEIRTAAAKAREPLPVTVPASGPVIRPTDEPTEARIIDRPIRIRDTRILSPPFFPIADLQRLFSAVVAIVFAIYIVRSD